MSRFYNLDQAPFNSRELSKAIVAAIAGQSNGAFFDAQDIPTMYQDSAGTTPVTAMEQPVGLWLDKSQGLQLGPELPISFGASWASGGGIYTKSTAGWAPIGYLISVQSIKTYLVSFKVVSVTAGSSLSVFVRNSDDSGDDVPKTFSVTAGNTYVCRVTLNRANYSSTVWLDSDTFIGTISNISIRELKGNHATQSIAASRPVISARKNLLQATDVLTTQSITSVATQQTLSFTGTGSVTLSGTATGTLTGTGANNRVPLAFTPTAGTLTLTVSGDVRLGQLEYGPTATTYQRVNTTTDYDTVGFPRYLKFDGVDDYLNLPYLGLYLNGSASIVAARDALSQATDTYVISERSTSNVNPKYFPSRQLANAGNMDAYIVNDAAAVVVDTVGSVYGGASDAVIRSAVDNGNNIKLFKNGALAANDNYTRSGTLTLTNTTIGASVSTTKSNYANMKLYGLVITKSALSDSERRRVERLLAYNSGAQI